jgi:hypothetical protein
MIEWSTHDVYEHPVSFFFPKSLPQSGAICNRGKFVYWCKLLQMNAFIYYDQEFTKKVLRSFPVFLPKGSLPDTLIVDD